MAKHHTSEQIIGLLRKTDVALAGGPDVPQVYRAVGASGQMFYCWRKEPGDVHTDWAKRLEDLGGPSG